MSGLLIVNADDWGISREDTEATLACFRRGSISSATGLVWMQDSDRAAAIAREEALPVGLHLNLIEPFTAPGAPAGLAACQLRIVRRLASGGLPPQLYHPRWARDFEYCIASQLSRFEELYGRPPTHVDGHRHMHLVPNALFSNALRPVARVRRPVNRLPHESHAYKRAGRSMQHQLVRRRFAITTWCFSLRPLIAAFGGTGIDRPIALARSDSFEVIVHPLWPDEAAVLGSAVWRRLLQTHRLGSFIDLTAR